MLIEEVNLASHDVEYWNHKPPKTAFAFLSSITLNLDKAIVQAEIMANGIHPAWDQSS